MQVDELWEATYLSIRKIYTLHTKFKQQKISLLEKDLLLDEVKKLYALISVTDAEIGDLPIVESSKRKDADLPYKPKDFEPSKKSEVTSSKENLGEDKTDPMNLNMSFDISAEKVETTSNFNVDSKLIRENIIEETKKEEPLNEKIDRAELTGILQDINKLVEQSKDDEIKSTNTQSEPDTDPNIVEELPQEETQPQEIQNKQEASNQNIEEEPKAPEEINEETETIEKPKIKTKVNLANYVEKVNPKKISDLLDVNTREGLRTHFFKGNAVDLTECLMKMNLKSQKEDYIKILDNTAAIFGIEKDSKPYELFMTLINKKFYRVKA
ncbi:MAG: hypothetical protein MUE53_09265 [Chitinophagales bacterium]|jgi:hypothetical protein|nr:hypothetical protein [Chitinophagales bacterium]